MDDVVTILLLVLLFVGGCLYAFVTSISNRRKLMELQKTLFHLQKEVRNLKTGKIETEVGKETVRVSDVDQTSSKKSASAEQSTHLAKAAISQKQVAERPTKQSRYFNRKSTSSAANDVKPGPSVISAITDNWMVWLGGISVGLAGIFMVKYSIEQGFLSPLARVCISILIGVLLHIFAEYLRRKKGGHTALAALCGGASITLFAALLAGHHLYGLFPSMVVFVALALVSLATMFLAIIHGPVLAILGILAAYSLPLLINTGSSNIAGALLYASIITASGLILTRYVISGWLWKSIVILTFIWAFLGITGSAHEPLSVSLYLVALGYMLMAIPHGDWLLRAAVVSGCPEKHPVKRFSILKDESDQLFFVFIGLLVLQVINLLGTPFSDSWLYLLPLLPVFMLIAIRKKNDFAALGWLSFVGCIGSLLSHFISFDRHIYIIPPEPIQQHAILVLFGGLVVIYSVFGLINVKGSKYKGFAVSLAAATPVVMLALIYSLLPGMRSELVLVALCLSTGVSLFFMAFKLPLASLDKPTLLSLLVSAHFAYALAVVYVFNEASLTLALSTEFILLAVVRKVFDAPELDWLIKFMVGVVVIRLTCNPFLLQYSPEIHWSLWTYGGSALCAVIGCRLLPHDKKIRCWLEGAALHLILLFIASELRYQLYDGNIFKHEYSSIEAAINTILWAGAAFVYYRRAELSDSFMALFYKIVGKLLFILAVANHLVFSLFVYNPLFSRQDVADTLIFNILLLAYGLPIIPMMFAGLRKVVKRQAELALMIGLSLFFFISIEIRHFFTPGLYIGLGANSAEIYTYSFIWLLIAVAAIVVGSRRQLKVCYKAGMVTILVVVAKIFFIDMAELEGLYRVASFMGLGMSLLAIAFLHKWLQKDVLVDE